jgi:hypothetical protein
VTGIMPVSEAVEFSAARASEESSPLCLRELQDGPFGIPAAADTDPAAGQPAHLHAVAVGQADGTLNPDHLLTLRHAPAVSQAGFWLPGGCSRPHLTGGQNRYRIHIRHDLTQTYLVEI